MSINSQAKLSEDALRAISELGSSSPSSQSVVIGVATTVEIYIDHLLATFIRESGVQTSRFGSALVAETSDSMRQSWANRLKWLRDGFGLDLAGTSVQNEMQTVIDLRNALLHGDGKLTPHQTRSLNKQLALERQLEKVLAVVSEAKRLRLTTATAGRSKSIAREYIIYIDDRLQGWSDRAFSTSDF